MKTQDLVVVRTFGSHIEADLAKSALDAAEIESFIQSDDAGGQRPHMVFAQGARLIVRAEDAERAARILDADESGGECTTLSASIASSKSSLYFNPIGDCGQAAVSAITRR